MECLVPHPEFKMLGLRNIPQMSEHSLAYSTFTWHGLIKHLRQMLIANAKMEEGASNHVVRLKININNCSCKLHGFICLG